VKKFGDIQPLLILPCQRVYKYVVPLLKTYEEIKMEKKENGEEEKGVLDLEDESDDSDMDRLRMLSQIVRFYIFYFNFNLYFKLFFISS
jgi:hypothetical protein